MKPLACLFAFLLVALLAAILALQILILKRIDASSSNAVVMPHELLVTLKTPPAPDPEKMLAELERMEAQIDAAQATLDEAYKQAQEK
jgi:hypothetical protein